MAKPCPPYDTAKTYIYGSFGRVSGDYHGSNRNTAIGRRVTRHSASRRALSLAATLRLENRGK